MISNRPVLVAFFAASLRPAPILRMACTNPASAMLPSAMQYSSQGMARTRTPPAGKIACPSTSRAVMNCASLRHNSGNAPAARRLLLYSSVICDMRSPPSGAADAHVGDRTSHRERWNGPVMLERPAAPGGGRHGEEGADLEPTLTGITIRRLVGIR